MMKRAAIALTILIAVTTSACSDANAAPSASPASSASDSLSESGERSGAPVPDSAGLSHAYRGTFAAEIPEHWTYRESPFDALAVTEEYRSYPTDYLGTWIPDGNAITGTHAVMIMHFRQGDDGATARDELDGPFAGGTSTTDDQGRTQTLLDSGTITRTGAPPIEWIQVEVDSGDGFPAVQRVFATNTEHGSLVMAFVSSYVTVDEPFISETIAVLESMVIVAAP